MKKTKALGFSPLSTAETLFYPLLKKTKSLSFSSLSRVGKLIYPIRKERFLAFHSYCISPASRYAKSDWNSTDTQRRGNLFKF